MIVVAHLGSERLCRDTRSLNCARRQSVDTHYGRERVLFANLIPGPS